MCRLTVIWFIVFRKDWIEATLLFLFVEVVMFFFFLFWQKNNIGYYANNKAIRWIKHGTCTSSKGQFIQINIVRGNITFMTFFSGVYVPRTVTYSRFVMSLVGKNIALTEGRSLISSFLCWQSFIVDLHLAETQFLFLFFALYHIWFIFF